MNTIKQLEDINLNSLEFKIPLRNKNRNIIAYTIVSEEDYDYLNQFKWYNDVSNYVSSKIKINNINTTISMHRYIFINILKQNITSKDYIDHINNNPLDNRRENLRLSNAHLNMQNKKKSITAGSKYFGVSYNKSKNTYAIEVKINGERIRQYYKDELFAAYAYNLLLDKYNLKLKNYNNITKPDNFLVYTKKEKKGGNDIPRGISLHSNNKYRIAIKEKNFFFDSLDDAKNKLQELKNEKLQLKLNTVKFSPILYNHLNQPIFKINKNDIEYDIIIDEDNYYDIIKLSWHISSYGYICGNINNTTIRLHRFILNYNGDDIVDHIDSNKFNNQKSNLRIITRYQNSMNRLSRINSSSKYIGVTKFKNGYYSNITVDGIRKYIGYYKNEEDAARNRDKATKLYFKEYGKLNFPDE